MAKFNWLSDVFKGFIGGALLVVVMTVGVPILAWLQSLPWYVIALSAIGTFVLTLLGINQVAVFKERRNKGFTTLDNELIEATLRKWLDKQGYSIRNAPLPDMRFGFEAQDIYGRAVRVARPRTLEEFIVIGNVWQIEQSDRQKFNNMDTETREKMLEDLRIEMLRFKVTYDGLKHPLEKVVVEVRVPCDETCTQALFLDRFETAKYAYILMTEIMKRALRYKGVSIDNIPNQP